MPPAASDASPEPGRAVTYHVFRNYTVEPFFAGVPCTFSGYGELGPPDAGADACVFFHCVPIAVAAARAAEEVLTFVDRLRLVREAIGPDRLLLVVTLAPIRNFGWVEADRQLEAAVHAFNTAAYELAATHPATACLAFEGFLASVQDGPQAGTPLFDWRYYYTYQTPLNPHLAGAFSAWFQERVEKLAFRRKKLLVLDLDGTLWAGVVGEGDAQIGGEYPGNAFLDVQRMIAAVKETGTLLAVISKNNVADVEAFFAHHPEMPLRLDDFVAVACNWQPKPDNLGPLLADLGLGAEAVVVLDDSPYEREHLRREHPLVTVPDLPEEPHALVPAVAAILRQHFSVYATTAEDRAKTQQYQQKRQADALRATLSHEEFVRSLGTRLTVAPLDAHSRARFLQLTQKTNQFNLTTLRLTEAELADRERRGEQAFVVSVADRFGSHGIAGGALVSFSADGAEAHLEAFLLSCRVLGRGVEHGFLAALVGRLHQRGVRRLGARFVRTARNVVAEPFLAEFGFDVLAATEASTAYGLAIDHPLPESRLVTVVGGFHD